MKRGHESVTRSFATRGAVHPTGSRNSTHNMREPLMTSERCFPHPRRDTTSRILIIGAAALLAGCGAGSTGAVPRIAGTILSADGAQLHYLTMGRGHDTVVVLHGGPGFHSGYLVRPLEPLALDGHTLVFYDLRGRGRSELVDTSRISATEDVVDLEHLRQLLHIDRLNLIAHGWGAGVAVLYAERHPAHVGRVAMISPIVPRPAYAWSLSLAADDTVAMRRLALERRARVDSIDPVRFCRANWGWQFTPARVTAVATQSALVDEVCDLPAASLRRVELVNRQIMRSLGESWDLRRSAARVEAPLLVIEGSDNPMLADAMKEWTLAAPNARELRLDAPATVPWAIDRRPLVEALSLFLRGRWPVRSERPRLASAN